MASCDIYQLYRSMYKQLLLYLKNGPESSPLSPDDIRRLFEHLHQLNFKRMSLNPESTTSPSGMLLSRQNRPDSNKNTMLLLTILRLLYKESRYNDHLLTNIDLDVSDSETLLSVVTTVKYERFILVKVVVALCGVPQFQNSVHHTVDNLVRHFLQARMDEGIHYMEIMKALLSSHNPSCDICMQKLLEHSFEICSHTQKQFSLDQHKNECSYHYLYSYLSFWQKMMKKSPEKFVQFGESIELTFYHHDFFFQLLPSEQTGHHVLNRFLLNLLNICLSNTRNEPFYLEISKKLLKFEKTFLTMELKSGYAGFGGFQNTLSVLYDGHPCKKCEVDLAWLRSLSLLHVKVAVILIKSDDDFFEEAIDSLFYLNGVMASKLEHTCLLAFDWLAKIFGEQDNSWIEILLTLLDIYLLIPDESKMEEYRKSFSPHIKFLEFLAEIKNDSNFLVDLLTSPETCFLLYFTKYLKCVCNDWLTFVQSHLDLKKVPLSADITFTSTESSDFGEVPKSNSKNSNVELLSCQFTPSSMSSGLMMVQMYSDSEDDDSNGNNSDISWQDIAGLEVRQNETDNQRLDDTMATLIRVRLKIERLNASGMFPYNPRPLLVLIEQCEKLYEIGF